MAVIDVIFLMITIDFVLVAFATAFATLGVPPTVRRTTNWVIYGCCVAALASAMLAAWFRFRPLAKFVINATEAAALIPLKARSWLT
jgi:predicted naringenin-chalcone synthase